MIKIVEDLGAPALVAAADIITTEKKPDWNRPMGIGISALGYILGGVMGIGGGFVKNLGIAAAPWAFESIYEYVKEASSTPVTRQASQQRLVMQPAARALGPPISRYPAPEVKEEFENIRVIG